MEEEQKINEQIKGLYKIFEFEPITAQDYGMYENDDEENDEPETLQEDEAILLKQEHAKFVIKNMIKQPRGMVGQDGGQPWFIFWNTQSLELLGLPNVRMDADMKTRSVDYLRQCHNPSGGFRGSPYL